MKIFVPILAIALAVVGCTGNPNYEKNLATAKETFRLFEAEKIEAQMALFSDDLVYTPPSYGEQPLSKTAFQGLLKMYHQAFDEIRFTPEIWLPGTDDQGKLDGSVRAYGTWNSIDAATGARTKPLRSYHFFNFDAAGKIIAQGDYFDATGLLNSINLKNTLPIDNENSGEITFILEMKTKASKASTKQFTQYLAEYIVAREPSIVYGYYLSEDGKKVTLIERYKNNQDAIQHGIDFIEGPNYKKFFQTFKIEKFITIGKVNSEFKKFAKDNGFDIEYRNSIGGYVRR